MQWVEAGPGHERADEDPGVAGNARLTSATALVLTVLLALEGLSLLWGVRQHLGFHAFVGTAVIPPAALKIGSTTWRAASYYRQRAAWVRKGPPPVVLRLFGPLLVVLTVVMLASGLALVLGWSSVAGVRMLQVHKASFIGWGVLFGVHFLGHLREGWFLGLRDLGRSSRRSVAGASLRTGVVVASLVVGLVGGALVLGPTSTYHGDHGFFEGH